MCKYFRCLNIKVGKGHPATTNLSRGQGGGKYFTSMTSASSLKEKFYKHHLSKGNFSGSHIIHFLLAVILYFNWQLQTISLMIDIFSTDLLSKLAKKNNDSSAFWCRSGVVSIWSMKYWWCCVYISVYFAKNNVHKEYGRKWGKKRGRFEIGNSACMCRM